MHQILIPVLWCIMVKSSSSLRLRIYVDESYDLISRLARTACAGNVGVTSKISNAGFGFYRASICEGDLGSRNSVRPSVCLSHACIVTKLNDAL